VEKARIRAWGKLKKKSSIERRPEKEKLRGKEQWFRGTEPFLGAFRGGSNVNPRLPRMGSYKEAVGPGWLGEVHPRGAPTSVSIEKGGSGKVVMGRRLTLNEKKSHEGPFRVAGRANPWGVSQKAGGQPLPHKQGAGLLGRPKTFAESARAKGPL